MRKLRFLMPIGFLALVAAFGAGVMLLWNWLMPAIFGLTAITFWQALGLLALAKILFSGFGCHHGHGHGHGHGGMHKRGKMLREKWMHMSPEQRKEFINKRREGFGFGRGFRFDECGCDTEKCGPAKPGAEETNKEE